MDNCSNFTHFLVAILLAMVPVANAITTFDFCSASEVEHGKKLCKDAYGDFGQGNDAEFCANVECFIQCMTDAIGECASRDMFYKDDMTAMKVSYRAKCDNPTLTRKAQKFCKTETPCIGKNFTADQLVARNNSTNDSQSNPAVVKRLECMLDEARASCTIVPTTELCRPDMAQLLGGISIVEHSLKTCGIRQFHYMFDVYKDKIQCKKPKIESHCYTPAFMSRMSKCTPVSLFHIMGTPLKGRESICENVECISKCYEEAIGECYKKNQYVMMDPETMIVSTRATCDRYEEVKSAMKRCRMIDIKCFQDLEADLTKAYLNLILKEKYAAYKTTACRSSAIFRSCIDYQYSAECSEQDATLLKSVYKSWHRYTQCDPRDDEMYNKYKGETRCGSNSAQQLLLYKGVLFVCLSALYALGSYF